MNSDIKYLINKDIRELDIQRAGLRALKNMGAITDETYDYWKSRDKRWSSVYIGKHLSSRMKEQNAMITSAVDKFVIENNINESNINGVSSNWCEIIKIDSERKINDN